MAFDVSYIFKARDKFSGVDRDIVNYTETMIDLSLAQDRFLNGTLNSYSETEDSLINVQRLRKSIDYLIYSTLGIAEELVKMTIEFGYKKPLDYDTIFSFLKYILIIVLIMVLIKPVGYILIFLIMGIIWIRDGVVKKRLKRSREKEKGYRNASDYFFFLFFFLACFSSFLFLRNFITPGAARLTKQRAFSVNCAP